MRLDMRVLVIVGGGIAAYKACEVIRLLRKAGAQVTPVLTKAGAQFVTPLTLAALAGQKCYSDLFDLTDEAEMGHIQLSRAADLLLVVPATADLIAKMAGGRADDLASTLLLATDKPVMIAPSMNVRMWTHRAVQRNVAALRGDGVHIIGPDEGDMACGEFGPGRMSEPQEITAAAFTALRPGPLKDRHIIVTSGPTHEPIDPVRYIANRSSGLQGTAIAAALRDLGARVSFITGPASAAPPEAVQVIKVETAQQMLAAVRASLPADAAVLVAAVADWHVANPSAQKLKKDASGTPPVLNFAQNPDILALLAQEAQRPALLIGFAAETENLIANATAKRARKGCDWIVANDVGPQSDVAGGIMGGADNAVTVIDDRGAESWPRLSKDATAARLAARIAQTLTESADERS